MSQPIEPSKNALFGFLGWFLPFLLTLLVTPLVISGLGASHYGIYALVIGSMASLVALLAPSRTVVRYIATTGATVAAGRTVAVAALTTTIAGAIIALLIALSATWLSEDVFGVALSLRGLSTLALRVAAVGLPLALLQQVLGSVPQGLQRFDTHALLVTGTATLLLTGNGILALCGAGLVTFVSWSIAVMAISSLAFARLAVRLLPQLRLRRPLDWASLAPHLGFATLVLASQAPGHLLLLFERTWIVRTLGASAFSFYVVPMMLGLTLHAAMSSLAGVFFPMASEVIARESKERLQAIYRRAIKLAAALLTLAVATLIASGERLLLLWLGPEFAERSTSVLALHGVAFGILALVIIPWSIADAAGRPSWNAGLAIAWMLLGGLLLVLLVPRFGIEGAAAARLATMTLVPFYAGHIERSLFGRVLWGFWIRLVAILGVTGVAIAFLQHGLLLWGSKSLWSLVLALPLSTLCFLGLIAGLRYFDRMERDWIKTRIRTLTS